MQYAMRAATCPQYLDFHYAVHMLHLMSKTITKVINSLRLPCLLLSWIYLSTGATQLQAQDIKPITSQAEMLRNRSGEKLNPNGFTSGVVVQLRKGMFYDVEKTSMGSVILSVDGESVEVPASDVNISKKIIREANPITGFIPGKLVVMSASYGPPTRRASPDPLVKRELQKIIPQQDINEPIRIPVTDALYGRKTTSLVGSTTSGRIDEYGNYWETTQTEKTSKNVLKLEYQYNGKTLTKMALEESELVLP